MQLTLVRVSHTHYATYGVLMDEREVPFAVTLERPWLDNLPSNGQIPGSCIPAGAYYCERVDSPKFGNTFEVKYVPRRTHILIHKGNLAEDTHGCILVGEEFRGVGIASSTAAFAEFLTITRDAHAFNLSILAPYGSR